MLMEEAFKVGDKLIKGYERSFTGSRLLFYVTKQQQQTKQGQKTKLSLIQGIFAHRILQVNVPHSHCCRFA